MPPTVNRPKAWLAGLIASCAGGGAEAGGVATGAGAAPRFLHFFFPFFFLHFLAAWVAPGEPASASAEVTTTPASASAVSSIAARLTAFSSRPCESSTQDPSPL